MYFFPLYSFLHLAAENVISTLEDQDMRSHTEDKLEEL